MAPASLQLTLFEPVVFLRGQSAVGEDARGRRRPINFDAPPSQLRGLLTLTLPRPSKIKEVSILLQGRARTDWPEGIGPNRLDTSEESIIFSQKIVLYSAKDAQAGQHRRRSNSVGTLVEETRDDRRRMDRSFSSNGSNSSHSLPRGGKLHETDRSPTLARSIGNAAARAGTAILPPTLIREFNASKQGQSTSSSAASSATRSASSSPMISPATPRLSLSRVASNRSSDCYFDPPPVYGPRNQNNSSSSSSNSSIPVVSEDTLSSSEPAVHSLSWPIDNLQDTNVISTTTQQQQQHPQSINAAGPSNRSILHPPGRQEGRQQSNLHSGGGVGVRFDPQAISAGLQQQHGNEATSNSGPQITHFHSEPNSTRTSSERSRSPSAHTFTSKGKGKATSSSPSPGMGGGRKGIKGLLGNLLREDDEAQRSNKSNSGSDNLANGNSSNNHYQPGSISTTEEESDYHEFKKGTYTYPFSIPLPSNLPPTLHADFGSNAYLVRAHVHRSGPLTSNLTCDKEITLVHAPDEDGQDENDAIVVERNWDDCLRYIIIVMGKSFPVGSKIPVWVKFVPTEKVRIHRIVASLEERTAYFAKGRRVARHEVPRRWNLLKMLPIDPISKEGILPIISDASDALSSSPVTPFAQAAAKYYSETLDVESSDVLASLMDPFGPWELAIDLEVPTRGGTIINISTNHKKSNIAVSHLVKLAIRVERLRGDGGERKLFDILIEAPVTINHSHTANAWLSLPDYWSVRSEDQADTAVSSSSSLGGGQQSGRREASSSSSSSSSHTPSAIRRQTAPSLTPGRAFASSKVETVNRPTSPSTAPPLQGRVNNNLIQLSQQWLSLSANADLTTGSNSTTTVTPVTAKQEEEQTGPPTYAMIDNARGSVDLPDRMNQSRIK